MCIGALKHTCVYTLFSFILCFFYLAEVNIDSVHDVTEEMRYILVMNLTNINRKRTKVIIGDNL